MAFVFISKKLDFAKNPKNTLNMRVVSSIRHGALR
jgi:hypothetical protein